MGTLSMRIDDKLKEDTRAVLESMSPRMDITEAVVLYFYEIVRKGKLPFQINTISSAESKLSRLSKDEMKEYVSLQMDLELFREMKSSLHATMVWYFTEHNSAADQAEYARFIEALVQLELDWGHIDASSLEELKNVPDLYKRLTALKKEYEAYIKK